MTALNFLINEDSICLAMDTLSINSIERIPHTFSTKFLILPHLNIIAAGTGDASLISEWLSFIRENIIARDIDHVNQYVPDALRDIAIKYTELETVTCTIYHFGYSIQRDRFLGYAYRSTNNWTSEELLSGVGIKPAVTYDFGNEFKIPDSFIELIKYQAELELIKPLDEKIGIGGDIHLVIMNRNGYSVNVCHRFDNYEHDFDIMCQNANKT